MKNYTKVLALSCLLIFALNICLAQTATDSTTVKKTVKQPKSRVYARLEMGTPLGFGTGDYGATTITGGYVSTITVGYSFSKCFRLGLGTGFLYNSTTYLPVLVSTEFGNHTKRVNASLNINAGYAFYYPFTLLDADQTSGLVTEFLPTISFGSYKVESRFRISLGSQFITTHREYNTDIFELYNSSNTREEYSSGRITQIRMNMLLKVGMDF